MPLSFIFHPRTDVISIVKIIAQCYKCGFYHILWPHILCHFLHLRQRQPLFIAHLKPSNNTPVINTSLFGLLYYILPKSQLRVDHYILRGKQLIFFTIPPLIFFLLCTLPNHSLFLQPHCYKT